MEVCVDGCFHHCYMDRGYYCIFFISDELNGRQGERQEIASLFFLCYKTHNFCLKLYTKFLQKYINGGFDMGLCHVKTLIFSH